MKIGIYGGTFDPPHIGHMESARAAAGILELDKLLFIPARLPPHKKLPAAAAAPKDRLAMTVLAADGLGLGCQAEVLETELEREGKSYTVDTLALLRERYPKDELWLLMGGDMFFSLHTWREPRRLLSMAQVAVFARSRSERAEDFERQREFLSKTYGARVRVLFPPRVIEISSTKLRGLLLRGEGGEMLWPPVYGYILMRGLYGIKADLKALSDEQLRAASFSMIRAKRIPHVLGTEETAALLAARWGVPDRQARRAAILHDCTKYLSLDEQLKCCQKYGILLDDLERNTLKLLHAKTGSALARHIFGEPEEVCQAIYWHTTGKENMTALEKVVYLADYIEPNRVFEGVSRLRELAQKDLDAALKLTLRTSVEKMEKCGLPVHPNTVRALKYLKG